MGRGFFGFFRYVSILEMGIGEYTVLVFDIQLATVLSMAT
jgi:hypothetical protein